MCEFLEEHGPYLIANKTTTSAKALDFIRHILTPAIKAGASTLRALNWALVHDG